MKRLSRVGIVLVAAAAVIVAFIVWFGYTLYLRNEFREYSDSFNNAVVSASEADCTISCDGISFPASQNTLNTMDRFLHDPYTVPIGTRKAAGCDDDVSVTAGDMTLVISGSADEAGKYYVLFETPEGKKGFMLGSQITFHNIRALYTQEELRSSGL